MRSIVTTLTNLSVNITTNTITTWSRTTTLTGHYTSISFYLTFRLNMWRRRKWDNSIKSSVQKRGLIPNPLSRFNRYRIGISVSNKGMHAYLYTG